MRTMKFMNNEDLDIPQPDPDWDYYILWHKLFKAKYKLEKLLKYVAQIESANTDSDQNVNEDLVEIINLLEETRITA